MFGKSASLLYCMTALTIVMRSLSYMIREVLLAKSVVINIGLGKFFRDEQGLSFSQLQCD